MHATLTNRSRARAQRRLQRDLRCLQEEPLESIAAEPLENDIFVWHANLILDGTPMHFEIYVPDTYPLEAPSVFFPTGISHPNCFPSRAPDGRTAYALCLDILGNVEGNDEAGSGWSSAYDLRALLAQLQVFVLDCKAQYKRAGSLNYNESLRRARLYRCPGCPHDTGAAAPRPPAIQPVPRRRSLLRIFAPSVAPKLPEKFASHSEIAACVCVRKMAGVAEPRPWRDVQRFAVHVQALARQAALGSDLSHADFAGFMKPKKGKTIRTNAQAEKNSAYAWEATRHAAAVRIQTSVRVKLAQALLRCLVRMRESGYMVAALRAARAECQKIIAGDKANLASLKLAMEAEEEARNAVSPEECALATAREQVIKKHRNINKKIRTVSDAIEKCTCPLEKNAKLLRQRELQKELKDMDAPLSVPAVLRELIAVEEQRNVGTVLFTQLFTEAFLQERQLAKEKKAKARQARRFAHYAVRTECQKGSSLSTHIGLALDMYVEGLFGRKRAERLLDVRECLSRAVKVWSGAAFTKQCDSCSRCIPKGEFVAHSTQCRRAFLSRPRDGTCFLEKVSYPIQVGVLLRMLSHQDLLPLTCANRKMRGLAEDGCLWSAQMASCFPMSALTPASVAEWKYAFLCEVNQAVASAQCFHTKRSLFDEGTILGIPIEFTVNPKTTKTDYMYSSMDFLSYDAFIVDGVRKTAYGETFTHWLPLFFSEAHWARAQPHLARAVRHMLPHRRESSFRADMALEVFMKMVNTLVVLICDKGVAFSERAIKAFCLLHRWALRCIEQWPELQQFVDSRVDRFCRGPDQRSKDVEPSLGEFLALLLLTRRSWEKVMPHVLEEQFDRQVLWFCTEYPSLANLSGRAAPTDEERLDLSWKAKLVGKRLLAFHAVCHRLLRQGRPIQQIIRDSDYFYGQPGRELVSKFNKEVRRVLDMDGWTAFYQAICVQPPTPQKLVEMLRTAVKNSQKRGYHRAGMDFNLVHASGTSKILRKGESYMAAATLKAVDLKEQWAWADGSVKYLDATCLVYDSNHSRVGVLDYHTCLTQTCGKAIKDGTLVHSGDQLDHEKQAGCHDIHIELHQLPTEIHYLYISVSSWAGACLSDIRQPSVRLVEAGGDELCRYDVDRADGSKSAILMCVLHRRPERSTKAVSRWALEAIGDVGHGAADNYDPIYSIIEQFRIRKGW